MTDLTINFACESRDEFCAFTIENWTLVDRGYFLDNTSHSENVASARREFTSLQSPSCSPEGGFTQVIYSISSLFQAFRQWRAVRSKESDKKQRGTGERGSLSHSLLHFFALLFTSHRSPLSERLEQAIAFREI